MRNPPLLRSVAWVAILAAVSAACVLAQPKTPKVAPSFQAMGTDGKTHTLASLTKDKQLVLYFIKVGCPVNAEAEKYFDRLYQAYKGKVNFYGVINADEAGYKQWKKSYKASYPVLLDPDKKIIRPYRATHSPFAVVVGPEAKVVLVEDGYSVGQLAGLGKTMAKAAKVPEKKLDLSGAPVDATAG